VPAAAVRGHEKGPAGRSLSHRAGVTRSGPRKSGTSEACLGGWPHSFPSSFLTPQIRRGSHRRSGGATHPSNEGSGQVSTTIVTRPSFTSPTPKHQRHSRATERHSVNPKRDPSDRISRATTAGWAAWPEPHGTDAPAPAFPSAPRRPSPQRHFRKELPIRQPPR
jgi:hypothetical protein